MINERFKLRTSIKDKLRKEPVNFGYPESGFGEYIYYKHYSRQIRDEDDPETVLGQENFHDTVIRVMEGVMSIRKDHYIRNMIEWDEDFWQNYSQDMAISMVRMEWLPPGRGLWAMGSPHVYERGSMALYNCAYTEIGSCDGWVEDVCWLMDTLMHGVGVGATPKRIPLKLYNPLQTERYLVPDTREGWVELVRRTLNAFADPNGKLPEPDVSLIRPKGSPIRTFGGIASGPEPLLDLVQRLQQFCYTYIYDSNYDVVRFFSDIVNCVGVCVVSGNVRRSAEILLGSVNDPVFMNLKNYSRYPERAAWGWMSNNTVRLDASDDFREIDQIALMNRRGYDVGYLNMKNLPKGRIGKDDDVLYDLATGLNPCGEIPLEHREVCNLAETLPTRCATGDIWYKACEYATFYCSTVALLPTHQPTTNAVVARNRRIGVSIVDFTGWKDTEGVADVIAMLREGYERVRETNAWLAEQAGVPRSIRLTTVKPGGTVPKMAGRTAGASHPTFRYTLMRVQVEKNHPVVPLLKEAGVPYEQSVYDANNYVFSWPVEQGPAEPAGEVSIWEQAFNIVLLQREWADNAVSNTLYFRPRRQLVKTVPKEHTVVTTAFQERELVGDNVHIYQIDPYHEEDQLEAVLTHIAPYVKSVSLLPHSDKGIFPQMPQEGISGHEYRVLLDKIKTIDWSVFEGSDGSDELYCTGDSCAV